MKTQVRLSIPTLCSTVLLLYCSLNIAHAAIEENNCTGAAAAEIYGNVDLIRAELDLIRKEMGIPYPGTLDLTVIGAKSREIYYQINTLLRKSRQLETESTFKIQQPATPLPIPQIDVAAILGELDKTLLHVRNVKRVLAIPEQPERKEFENGVSCNTVFRAVVKANREINELLHGHYSPNDVFLELEVAMKYAASLRAKYPALDTTPKSHPFERGKRPMDVYSVLLRVYDLVHKTVARLGFSAPNIRVRALDEKTVTPSDVYDLGKLIVSELAFLAATSGIDKTFEEVDFPDVNKLPAHVYQRAKTLEMRISELAQEVAKDTGPLTANTN